MKAWLKAARHLPKKQFLKTLKRKLIGHYNYYYVRGNSRSLWSYYNEVIKLTKKWPFLLPLHRFETDPDQYMKIVENEASIKVEVLEIGEAYQL